MGRAYQGSDSTRPVVGGTDLEARGDAACENRPVGLERTQGADTITTLERRTSAAAECGGGIGPYRFGVDREGDRRTASGETFDGAGKCQLSTGRGTWGRRPDRDCVAWPQNTRSPSNATRRRRSRRRAVGDGAVTSPKGAASRREGGALCRRQAGLIAGGCLIAGG